MLTGGVALLNSAFVCLHLLKGFVPAGNNQITTSPRFSSSQPLAS